MTPSHRTTRHCTGTGALAAFLLLAALPRAGHADPAPTWQEVTVSTLRGSGALPVLVSGDWTQPEPEITRVVITVHGERRDAYAYNAIAHEALARAGVSGRGTLLVTPRFPNQDDPTPGHLFWPGNGWIDGMDAASPAALGSFDAMDALIARLSDRRLFPSLASIVLVGHSAGGQFVQRYAELTQAEARTARSGIILRYVIANPSSYSYFTTDRPTPKGGFAPYPLDQCHRFNQWKYGLEQRPAYAGDATAVDIERDYVQRDVTYLLGGRDTDPDLAALDRSCAAEAQGPSHLARGRAFFGYLQLRHPGDLRQHLHEIDGIGHDAHGMLTSACALAAIFNAPPCDEGPSIPVARAETHAGTSLPPAAPAAAPLPTPASPPPPPLPPRTHH